MTSLRPTSDFASVPRLACCRPTPRDCVNRPLADALAPLRQERFLEYGSQHHKSISYATCISVILGCPYKIETLEQAQALHKVGPKLSHKIQEFLSTGRIERAEQAKTSPRLLALAELQSVYGIGTQTSLSLFSLGLRSIADLIAYNALPSSSGGGGGKYTTALKYQQAMTQKISRVECESIAEFVAIQLERIEPGAKVVLCGSYRRGKSHSSDVDILITYPFRSGLERGLLTRLLARLKRKGFIPSDGVLNSTTCATDRVTTPSFTGDTLLDSLDRAFVMFNHPPNGTNRMMEQMRRVDIIFCGWESFGSAVLGWTGSTQFERDLRRRAKEVGLKFDSGGLHHRLTGATIPALTEKDVFRALGLEWIPPHLRCCDP